MTSTSVAQPNSATIFYHLINGYDVETARGHLRDPVVEAEHRVLDGAVELAEDGRARNAGAVAERHKLIVPAKARRASFSVRDTPRDTTNVERLLLTSKYTKRCLGHP